MFRIEIIKFINFLNQSIVCKSPSFNWTLGSQFNNSFAKWIDGSLYLGSSTGSSKYSNFKFGFIKSLTSFASSLIENLFGFPTLTGLV